MPKQNAETQVKEHPASSSNDLLAALERSMRKSQYATSCVTVVSEIKIGRQRAQVQVRVTKDEWDFCDIKHAGIKCS